MITNPIIPIGAMIAISIILLIIILIFEIRSKKKHKAIGIILKIISIILLFIINLRPMIYMGQEDVVLNDIDVLFVLDTTISMSAKDMNSDTKTRLDRAKSDIVDIIQGLPGSRFGLITFDNRSNVVMPFTTDSKAVKDAVDAISVKQYILAQPSSPDVAIYSMKELLEQNGNNRQRIVFYFSDGEITNDEPLKSFSGLQSYINNGAVLGYGSKNGSKLYYSQSYNQNIVEVMQDPTNGYKDAISKIDENNLKQIASDLKLDYYNMSNDKLKLDSKVSSILKLKNDGYQTTGKKKVYGDLYYVFSSALVCIMLIDFVRFMRSKYGK